MPVSGETPFRGVGRRVNVGSTARSTPHYQREDVPPAAKRSFPTTGIPKPSVWERGASRAKLRGDIASAVEDTRDFERLGALANHQIISPDEPEKDGFVRQIWTFMAESRIICESFASVVNVRFEPIGGLNVVGSDESPDVLQVVSRLGRKFLVLH
jgi:hypothetical protein